MLQLKIELHGYDCRYRCISAEQTLGNAVKRPVSIRLLRRRRSRTGAGSNHSQPNLPVCQQEAKCIGVNRIALAGRLVNQANVRDRSFVITDDIERAVSDEVNDVKAPFETFDQGFLGWRLAELDHH